MKKFLRNRLCIPVKGFNRSIIYDLIRNDYFFISNEIFSIIQNDDVIKNLETTIDNKWLTFLLEEEILFEIKDDSERDYFPSLDKSFKTPFLISDVIIHDNINIRKIYKLLNGIDIRNISIIVEKYNKDRILLLLKNISALEVDSINLWLIEEGIKYNHNSFGELKIINQIFNCYLFNSTHKALKASNIKYFNIIEIPFSFDAYSKNVFTNKLGVNLDHFFEANNFHNYYNGKVYIDINSNIKNGVNCEISHGKVEGQTQKSFLELIKSKEFQIKWNINKANTLVCSDCEFRFMCVDPRDIKELGSSGYWGHSYECNYNPYISKWNGEKGYMNLTKSGIELKNNSVIIKKAKLDYNFEKVWS